MSVFLVGVEYFALLPRLLLIGDLFIYWTHCGLAGEILRNFVGLEAM